MTTQFARASYQEIIDLKTTTDTVSVIGIHCPTSKAPYEYLTGFFRQFKKYRYLGCSLALVPSARLPADISQVGYEGGQAPIDARDILNPILFHGCHGNSLGPILDGFLNGPGAQGFGPSQNSPSTEHWRNGMGPGSAFQDLYEGLYYRALTDNTWMKAHPQSGFRKKGMHPLVYDLSTNHPIGQYARNRGTIMPAAERAGSVAPRSGQFGDAAINNSGANGTTWRYILEEAQIGRLDIDDASGSTPGDLYVHPAFEGNSYFTSRLHPLGWIDTTLRVMYQNDTYKQEFDGLAPGTTDINTFVDNIIEMPNVLPLLYMGVIMLPPAYKANQYMRLILNHHFAFKGFRGISTNNSWKGQSMLSGGSNIASQYYPIPSSNSKDGVDYGTDDGTDDGTDSGFDDDKSYL